MQDGSMRSYNIRIKPENLAILDAAPMAETYVPCDFVANYNPNSNTSELPADHPDRVATVIGVRCRYKGSSGSFGGCINQTTGGRIPPNPARNCKLSWKINLKRGKTSGNSNVLLGSKIIQMSGMAGDATLTRNMLGYAMLRDAGLVAPCNSPAMLYVNGEYHGLYGNVENPDKHMTSRRPQLASDEDNGKGTLYKETWPMSSDPEYYVNTPQIPGLSNPGIKSKGGGDKSHIFAQLYTEAKACVKAGDSCTVEHMNNILDKYVDVDSFVGAMAGLAMTGNWDSPMYINHNYMIYVRNNKLFYIHWDLDQTATAPGTGFWAGPTSGGYPFPWFHVTNDTALLYSKWSTLSVLCQGCSTQGGFEGCQGPYVFGSCNYVNALMARAWKDKFFETYERMMSTALEKATQHVTHWQQQRTTAINCQSENGYFPTLQQQQAALNGSPDPQYAPFSQSTGLEQWFNYLQQTWINAKKGMWPLPNYGESQAAKNLLFISPFPSKEQKDLCLMDFTIPAQLQEVMACIQTRPDDPSCVFSEKCRNMPVSDECKRTCGIFFYPCQAGLAQCASSDFVKSFPLWETPR